MNDVIIEILHGENITVFILERGKNEIHETFKDESKAINFVIEYLTGGAE